MKSKPYSELMPIDKHVFRRHVLKFLIFQSALSLSFYFISKLILLPNSILYYVLGIAVFLIALYLMYSLTEEMSRRFKDIYPETDFKADFQLCVVLIPVFFFGAIIFLSFKEKDTIVRKALPLRYAFLALLPCLCLQLVSPSVSYFMNNPVNYLTIEIFHNFLEIRKYDGKFIDYQIRLQRKLSLYESGVLFLVSTSRSKFKISEKLKAASDKDLSEVQQGLLVSENSYQWLHLIEQSKTDLKTYSPLHWLNGLSLVQIVMLEETKRIIARDLNSLIKKENPVFLGKLEKQVNRLPANLQPQYREDIKILRHKFQSLK